MFVQAAPANIPQQSMTQRAARGHLTGALMRNLAAVMAVGLCLFAGIANAAVTTATHTAYALRPCSTCREVSYPTEAECREAAQAEARRVGETRTTGSAVYTCITRHNVIATFRANPVTPPPPVDCVVSEWSPWSDPPWLACADTQQTRALVRTRTIVTQPANGGAACPSLVETQTETRQCPGIAILSWRHDGLRTDGYRIVYGTSPTALTRTLQLASPALRSYVMRDLTAGQYYFAVKAYSAGTESDPSNVEAKLVQ